MRIDSEDPGAYAGWSQTVSVDPDITYRITGWMKTENVDERSEMGALLNVHEI
jgi:hypothetical protein